MKKFSSQIAQILEDYGKEVKEVVNESIEAEAPKIVKELKKTSPKDRGEYAKGWKKKVDKDRLDGIAITVYNEKHYRLTHLLEKGHALRGGGRTSPQPHIAPAQEKAEQDIIKEITEKLS